VDAEVARFEPRFNGGLEEVSLDLEFSFFESIPVKVDGNVEVEYLLVWGKGF